MAAIEERARSELGMIGRNETFYQVVPVRPRTALPTKPPNTRRPPRADVSYAPHALFRRHPGRGQRPAVLCLRSEAIRRPR